LAIPSYIKSLLNILNGNTEIQLKILQVLLSVIYKINSLHGEVIYDVSFNYFSKNKQLYIYLISSASKE